LHTFEEYSQIIVMLVEFTVGNFLSFKDKKTLSLSAASISDFKETNVIETDRYNLLKGAVIYGANASGKSNFMKAMSTMRWLVLDSVEQSSAAEIDVTPFLLNTATEKLPTHFEMVFLLDDIRYRYGFEVNTTAVRAEWLFEAKKNQEKLLFAREGDAIEVEKAFAEGKGLESKTRDNALFLSVVDQFNGQTARSIIKWFNNFITISGLSHEEYKVVTFEMLKTTKQKDKLLQFYKSLDLGFQDIKTEKKLFDPKELPTDMPEQVVKQLVSDLEGAYKIEVGTLHKKFDKKNKAVGLVEFDMRSQESAGTNKIFNISGPVFDVLTNGGVLAIDEMDASLHPLLTLAITRLFNSSDVNAKNAQLIFTTHDTNLFAYSQYRRDQIYFVEKDNYEASDLYSLIEYKEEGKTIRKDRSFAKDYIEGRYGAIPFIGNLPKFK
jgi:uncharacterized protein